MKRTVKNIMITSLISSLMINCNYSSAMKKTDWKKYDTSWIFNKKNENSPHIGREIREKYKKNNKTEYLFQLKHKDGRQQSYIVEIDEQNKKCKIEKVDYTRRNSTRSQLEKILNSRFEKLEGKEKNKLADFVFHTYPELISVSNDEYNDICSMLVGNVYKCELTIKRLLPGKPSGKNSILTNSQTRNICSKSRNQLLLKEIVYKRKIVKNKIPEVYQYLIRRNNCNKSYILSYYPEKESSKIDEITDVNLEYLSSNNYLKPVNSEESGHYYKMPNCYILQKETEKLDFSSLDDDVSFYEIVKTSPNSILNSSQYLSNNQKKENLERVSDNIFNFSINEDDKKGNESYQSMDGDAFSNYLNVVKGSMPIIKSRESSFCNNETLKDELLLAYNQKRNVLDNPEKTSETSLKINSIEPKLPGFDKFGVYLWRNNFQNMLKEKDLNSLKS